MKHPMGESGPEREMTALLSAGPEFAQPPPPGSESSRQPAVSSELPAFFAQSILRHKGTVAAATSPEFRSEFRDVGNAAACAIEVQKEAARVNAGLPVEERIAYRIGINRGDFFAGAKLRQGDMAYAEQLRNLAEPGGVCLCITSGNRVTRNIASAEILDERPLRRNPWAYLLQAGMLLSYFLFWYGLITWKVWYIAVYKVAPCWPSFMCD
jgi:hypothetical protein